MKKIIIILFVVSALVITYFAVTALISKIEIVQEPPSGSVMRSGEYHSTSTYAGVDGLLGGGCRTDGDVLVNYNVDNPTTLGSVVVASTTSHAMRIKSATSTVEQTGHVSTTVALLPASLPQGTYTFDIDMTRGIYATRTHGLVLDFEDGFCGEYIITWR